MTVNFVLVFFVSFFVVYLLTPFIRALGLKFLAIDKKNKRKMHTKVITKLGGIAVYVGFWGAMVLPFILSLKDYRQFIIVFLFYFFVSSIVLLLGVFDDIKGANALTKFSVQVLVAIICIKFGYFIRAISFGVLIIDNVYFMYFFTIVWITGVINAINLIDGLDGLACGIVGIISFIFGIILVYYGNVFEAMVAFALFGGCVGFLKYNFHPAKIFMGDTGSLFMGIVLALLSIKIANFPKNSAGIFLPVLIMSMPLLDMARVFFLRLVKRKHPFQADNSHIHHILIKHKFTHPNTVLILYVFVLFLGIIGFYMAVLK